MKITVGDIVFVLDKKTRAVVPCQLVEIISSITQEGESVRHVVVTPTGKKRFEIESHTAPWFETHEKAHEYLKTAALKLVDDTMKKAKKVAFESFGVDVEGSISPVPEEVVGAPNAQLPLDGTDSIFVDMAGQKVKVSLPKELSNV